MSVLCDDRDPTTALFLSVAACARAGRAVLSSEHGHKIKRMVPRRRERKGQILGYALILHFKDRRPASPLTNSDFERITQGA